MGKGTNLRNRVVARPLTQIKLRARDAAIASGGEVEATPRGTLEKRTTPTAAPQEVSRKSPETWD